MGFGVLRYDDVCVPGCRLRVEVELKSTGQWLWAEYDSMTVESENDNYTLHVTGYYGNAGDAFNDDHVVSWQSNGMQFSTPDADNDQNTNGNCAWHVGWWFNWCSSSNLNGINKYWYSTAPENPTLVRASRMMLQCGAVLYEI